MQMIYNSPNYCIVEFTAEAGQESLVSGGFEIVDKNYQREIFFRGTLAEQFRQNVRQLFASSSIDDIEKFLGNIDKLTMQPVVIH